MSEHPKGTVSQVASSIVGGLQDSPLLLALLVLNAIGIGAATWFLARIADQSGKRMDMILKACLPHIGGAQ